jgi:adenine-specific DNA-methyltransferase
MAMRTRMKHPVKSFKRASQPASTRTGLGGRARRQKSREGARANTATAATADHAPRVLKSSPKRNRRLQSRISFQFAPLIREARKRAGMNQDDVAEAAGCGARAIWQVEQGAGTLKTLIPILQVLRIAITGLPPARDLGARVKAAREKRGWSFARLSRECLLSIPTLRGLEKNAGRVTSLEAVIRTLAPDARERRPSRPQPTSIQELIMTGHVSKTFVNADCIPTMRSMEASSIDLVVTSPPYNLGKPYEEIVSLKEHLKFADEWISCIPRLLRPTGAMWINLGYAKISDTETMPLTYRYYDILKRHGLHVIQEIIWAFEGGMAYTRRFSHRTERLIWAVKDPTQYIYNLDAVRDPTLNRTSDPRNNPFGKNPTDLWIIERVVGGRGAGKGKTIHPCPYPAPLVERPICCSSRPGHTVLDPFGGSGTTALVAHMNGRSAISIEIDPVYHEIARNRKHV